MLGGRDMQRFLMTFAIVLISASRLAAEDGDLRLAVPQVLQDAGFVQYVAPRFSLKTSVRITQVAEGDTAQMRFGAEGTPVFVGAGQRWSLAHDGDPRAVRFLDWLQSDIGKNTIESFVGADGATFSAQLVEEVEAEVAIYEGDAAKGETLSLSLCGRCHVVNETNRMKGIGSTPSFRLLRALPNWDTRFATFHLLSPHPSFTQIADVSDPFDPARPPPIAPMEMTLQDLEAILAYVSAVEPADLGAPLHLQ
jgi:mono/diheme cytochrome c family protein